MSRRGHIRVFLVATLVWAGFLAAGWPAYYQQYSRTAMVWFLVLLLVPITAIARVVLKSVPISRRMEVALWLAFYFTIPLAVYDWVYCGLYLGHGAAFLSRFWYLSVYYVIPWLLLPALAMLLNRSARDRSPT